MTEENVCFVCDGRPQDRRQESPHSWLTPRTACAAHTAQAVFPTGEKVTDWLERHTAATPPPEGGGLNYILNPVTIEGVRGWNDFAAGGRAVLEEIFPSDSYFAYVTQHTDAYLEILYAFHTQRALFAGGVNVGGLATCLRSPQEWDQFGEIQANWSRERRVQNALRRLEPGWVSSLEEAAEIWRTSDVSQDTFAPGDITKLVTQLLALAEARFAHLED